MSTKFQGREGEYTHRLLSTADIVASYVGDAGAQRPPSRSNIVHTIGDDLLGVPTGRDHGGTNAKV